jgi:anthranilate phosphoribosyltransferase
MLSSRTIDDIVNARLPEPEIAEHLVRLSSDGITGEIIGGFVDCLRNTVPPRLNKLFSSDAAGTAGNRQLFDCCGTGGSGKPHFNTSTTVAFVLAAGGVPVAKFGNRAASSASGSFDFLEAIGIGRAPVEAIPELIDRCGLAFLFAPDFYPALKALAPVRQKIGAPTIFNLIGPLLNPADPGHRLIGVSDLRAHEAVGRHLENEASCRHAMVVRSASGLDEIAFDEHTDIIEVNGTTVKQFKLQPSEITDTTSSANTPGVGSVATNRDLFFHLIDGGEPDNVFDLVCLNAGAGFYVAGKANTLKEGFSLAIDLIESGAVKNKYDQIRTAYERHSC